MIERDAEIAGELVDYQPLEPNEQEAVNAWVAARLNLIVRAGLAPINFGTTT